MCDCIGPQWSVQYDESLVRLNTAYLLSTDRENEANKMYIILYAAG